jgi:hypothetical protein
MLGALHWGTTCALRVARKKQKSVSLLCKYHTQKAHTSIFTTPKTCALPTQRGQHDGEITTNPVRNSPSQKLFLLARVQPILGAGGR